jgi:hypothetical protein
MFINSYISAVNMVTLWQNNRSFEETNLHMLQNEVLCDVTLLAGSNRQVIRAHKFILASRSTGFYAMFCNSSDKLTDTIEVADVDFEVLKEIVRLVNKFDMAVNYHRFNVNFLCNTFPFYWK